MNGFGLEFFVECMAGELTQKGDDVAKSWQFQLLYTVSQLAAGVLHAAGRDGCQKLAGARLGSHTPALQATGAYAAFWTT